MKMAGNPEFGSRLKEAFGGAKNGVIGRKIGVSENTVGFYVRGRVPDWEILLRIASVTECSIDWLLTGEGSMKRGPDRVDFLEALRGIIRELIKEELASVKRPVYELDLKEADEKSRKSG